MKELMARSQASIYALYALLDIHIHYDGWDLEKVSGFLQTYYGISDAEVCEECFIPSLTILKLPEILYRLSGDLHPEGFSEENAW